VLKYCRAVSVCSHHKLKGYKAVPQKFIPRKKLSNEFTILQSALLEQFYCPTDMVCLPRGPGLFPLGKCGGSMRLSCSSDLEKNKTRLPKREARKRAWKKRSHPFSPDYIRRLRRRGVMAAAAATYFPSPRGWLEACTTKHNNTGVVPKCVKDTETCIVARLSVL
jgi:hypothetical protein